MFDFDGGRQACVIAIIALIELLSHFLYYLGLNCTPASVAVIMELSHPLLILTVVCRPNACSLQRLSTQGVKKIVQMKGVVGKPVQWNSHKL